MSNTGGIYHVIIFIIVTEQGAGHFPHGHFLMANQINSSQTQQLKRRRKKFFNTKWVKSDLSVSTDEGGLQQVASTPRVLALPHQVSGWVVGSTTRCSPDLEKSNIREFVNCTEPVKDWKRKQKELFCAFWGDHLSQISTCLDFPLKHLHLLKTGIQLYSFGAFIDCVCSNDCW